MKYILTFCAAAGLVSGTATAQKPDVPESDPVMLEEAEMDTVSAGVLDNLRVGVAIPISIVNAVNLTNAIGILSENIMAGNVNEGTAGNVTGMDLGDYFNLSGMGL